MMISFKLDGPINLHVTFTSTRNVIIFYSPCSLQKQLTTVLTTPASRDCGFVVYLTPLSVTIYSAESMDIVHSELERMRKEAVLTVAWKD
jgi:hypothetical protein